MSKKKTVLKVRHLSCFDFFLKAPISANAGQWYAALPPTPRPLTQPFCWWRALVLTRNVLFLPTCFFFAQVKVDVQQVDVQEKVSLACSPRPGLLSVLLPLVDNNNAPFSL